MFLEIEVEIDAYVEIYLVGVHGIYCEGELTNVVWKLCWVFIFYFCVVFINLNFIKIMINIIILI